MPDEPARAAIVVVHGGSWTRGDKADIAWRAVCQWLASAGYVAFSVNYRLAPANVFPAAIDDVQAAVALAARRRADHPVPHRSGSHRRVRRVGRRQPGGPAGHARIRGSRHRIPRRRGRRAERPDRPHRPRHDRRLRAGAARLPGLRDRGRLPGRASRPRPSTRSTRATRRSSSATRPSRRSRSQQAELFVAGLRAAGVATEFVTVEGALHSIAMLDADLKARIIDFFDGTIGTPPDPLVQPGDGAG